MTADVLSSIVEYLNWYCYENPEDLSVAMSHKNYPRGYDDAETLFTLIKPHIGIFLKKRNTLTFFFFLPPMRSDESGDDVKSLWPL